MLQSGSTERSIFGGAKHGIADPSVSQHLRHSLAVSAIGEDRHLSIRRHAGLEYGFDAKGATALEQDRFPAALAGNFRQLQQSFPHRGNQCIKVKMPRTGVVQHGFLNAEARRKRPRREEQFVSCRG